MKFVKLLVAILSVVFLTACGPSDKDAKKIGFRDAEEMKTLQAKGFATKADWNKLGFSDVAEMDDIRGKGFATKKDWNDRYIKLGFASLKQMEALQKKGFENFKNFKDQIAQKGNDVKWMMSLFEEDAMMECGVSSNEYVRSAFRNKTSWEAEDRIWLRFGSYLLEAKKPGVVTLISNKMTAQNGFGADVRVKLYCDYDVLTDSAIGFDWTQGN
jgi:hypothetical protein